MGFHLRRKPCERAVRAISLRIDDELSELEEHALDRHLAQCESCRTIAEETLALTEMLRGAPLLEPQRTVVVPSPRRARARLVRRGAAALVLAGGVAASLLGVFSGSLSNSGPSAASSALAFRNLAEQRRFVAAEMKRLESHPQFVVDEVSPRFHGRGLL